LTVTVQTVLFAASAACAQAAARSAARSGILAKAMKTMLSWLREKVNVSLAA
jgi:hypothetical protein